jgi:hypothetical protein
MGKKTGFRFGFVVKIRKFHDVDPGSGMEKIRIQDEKNSDPG